MIVNAIARPTGEGGVSTISSAAGRNASSSLVAALASRLGKANDPLSRTSWMPACSR